MFKWFIALHTSNTQLISVNAHYHYTDFIMSIQWVEIMQHAIIISEWNSDDWTVLPATTFPFCITNVSKAVSVLIENETKKSFLLRYAQHKTLSERNEWVKYVTEQNEAVLASAWRMATVSASIRLLQKQKTYDKNREWEKKQMKRTCLECRTSETTFGLNFFITRLCGYVLKVLKSLVWSISLHFFLSFCVSLSLTALDGYFHTISNGLSWICNYLIAQLCLTDSFDSMWIYAQNQPSKQKLTP